MFKECWNSRFSAYPLISLQLIPDAEVRYIVYVFQQSNAGRIIYCKGSDANIASTQVVPAIVYTAEDYIVYKANANCDFFSTDWSQRQKVYGKVYKGCLLFPFKIHKLNYNTYNKQNRNLHILPNLCEQSHFKPSPLSPLLCLLLYFCSQATQKKNKQKKSPPPSLPT